MTQEKENKGKYGKFSVPVEDSADIMEDPADINAHHRAA